MFIRFFQVFTLKTEDIFHLYFLINQAKHLEEKELMDLIMNICLRVCDFFSMLYNWHKLLM